MPGIFGVVDTLLGRSPERHGELVDIVERMAAAMAYEAVYSTTIVSAPELGVCAGRVGLFGDGRTSERTNPRASVALTTAEPVIEVLDEEVSVLEDGEAVGTGALEVLRVFRRLGEDGLKRVEGTFAALVIDRPGRQCVLFNDAYGMERIFLHTDGSRTFFSSEAKAILAVAPRTRCFDPKGLAEFLACGCTLGTHSLFRGIEVLDGGTVVRFAGDGTVTRRAYFDRSSLEGLAAVSERQFLDGLTDRLHAAVNAGVSGPSIVGISLTGGLDSRMIMACLDATAGTVPCYTFGSMYRETYDVTVGRQVAERCGQTHRVLTLQHDFLVGIRPTIENAVYFSDGYIGFSGAAELYLNKQARSIAPVRMTGNWGSELLRGVRAFKFRSPKGGFLQPVLRRELEGSADAFSTAASGHPLSYTLFHHMPSFGYGRYAIERSQVTMRAPFLSSDVVRWLYQAPESARRTGESASTAVIRRRPELLSIPTDFGLLGTDFQSIRSLRQWYRQTLFKAEYIASHGAPDWFAAVGASLPGGLIERPFLGRHKFQHFRRWFQRELAAVINEVLQRADEDGLGTWFDLNRVRSMVDEHVRGRANYTDEIDKIVTVALASNTLLAPTVEKPAQLVVAQ